MLFSTSSAFCSAWKMHLFGQSVSSGLWLLLGFYNWADLFKQSVLIIIALHTLGVPKWFPFEGLTTCIFHVYILAFFNGLELHNTFLLSWTICLNLMVAETCGMRAHPEHCLSLIYTKRSFASIKFDITNCTTHETSCYLSCPLIYCLLIFDFII